jgi:hypothetical protein
MQQAILGTVSGMAQTTRVIEALKTAGFTNDDISVLMPDEYGAQELGYEKHSKAPEGIAFGAFLGAIIGGVLGYLAGIGVIAISGLGSLVAAGPALATLSGIAVLGMVGGVIGALIGLGFPEYEAKKYERKIKFGNTLISIHTDNQKEVKVAEEILKNEGVQNRQVTAEESIKRKPVQLQN